MENKTNLIMAICGYKSVKKEKKANLTDITGLDSLNKKVLLRIIEPLNNEYINADEIKNAAKTIEEQGYDSAFLISKKFTGNAIEEMKKQKIQYVSDDYMPPFGIEELYLAIISYANNQCQKKCGKTPLKIVECDEKAAYVCKTRSLAQSANGHFENGEVGLLKNDLKIALALNH